MTERPASDGPEAEEARQRLERECTVETFVAGGPGGQHRNRTESGVRVRHLPTGIVVSATERRSQHQNRAVAFERLEAKLAERARRAARPKRKATRPSAGAKRRRLEAKRRRGVKKALRRIEPSEE